MTESALKILEDYRDEDGLDHCSHQRQMEGVHNDYSTLDMTVNK